MSPSLQFLLLSLFISLSINPTCSSSLEFLTDEFSITGDAVSFHGDYSPPSPPPPSPPPHPPSVSCEDDLKGTGSLNAVCRLNSSLEFGDDVYIEGSGSLYLLNDVVLSCPIKGCSFLVNMSKGDFVLENKAGIVAGTVLVTAYNVSLSEGSVINSTGLAGEPPAQTSGTPAGFQGAGGGHGGRGATCVTDNTKLPDDVWGGDSYAWSELHKPWSFGSKGGTTSKEASYGGEGGGRIWLEIVNEVEVEGSLVADGGDGGVKGGGGSGGSIYVTAHRM